MSAYLSVMTTYPMTSYMMTSQTVYIYSSVYGDVNILL